MNKIFGRLSAKDSEQKVERSKIEVMGNRMEKFLYEIVLNKQNK
tara:strand:+ start:2829 stop:2960 length:132 start_codon:yes stop_codon:yes gene_type:complete